MLHRMLHNIKMSYWEDLRTHELVHQQAYISARNVFYLFFVVTILQFCGTAGILCFGLQFTPPMGFKARVDAPLPVLSVTCQYIMNPPSQL